MCDVSELLCSIYLLVGKMGCGDEDVGYLCSWSGDGDVGGR